MANMPVEAFQQQLEEQKLRDKKLGYKTQATVDLELMIQRLSKEKKSLGVREILRSCLFIPER